ncbi:pentatricopeptide repeat-containing protein mitochondrial-like [Trifolium pratense]|uniref:Pentatricopeptide repeat-containing protein mitochondrial-like n=1 Tax=Trifolium pratense TaxID=57577 RepID=A0A2K3LLX9_TRIPR|nr:pentatricopeptide repeat-containing protein mitochondrial-like [Trifolium pratense]
MLDCICKICCEKDPFKLRSESLKLLVEMDQHGVPRNVETFNVLIMNLCHTLKVFAMMKVDGCEPGVKTYDLLMTKLGAHNHVEARGRGLDLTPKEYVVDPKFLKKKEKKAVKGEKKREIYQRKWLGREDT